MTLILDLACQDNAASPTVDDASDNNFDPAFNNGTNSSVYSVLAGPGGSLTRAFDGAALSGNSEIIADNGGGIELGPFIDTDQFCAQFFAKRDSTANQDGLIYDQEVDTPAVAFNSGGNTIAAAGVGTKATGVTTTAWHHYAINYKTDGTADLYVDGTLVGAFSTTRDSTLRYLSQYGFDGNNWFIGKFCGIRVYDTVRTQPQIATDALIGGIGATGSLLPLILNGGMTGGMQRS